MCKRHVAQKIINKSQISLHFQEKYPHISWIGCNAHALDLLLEDIAEKMDWAAEVIGEAKEVRLDTCDLPHTSLLCISSPCFFNPSQFYRL